MGSPLIGGMDWMPPLGTSTQIITTIPVALNSAGTPTLITDITSLLQPQYSAVSLFWLWDNVSANGAVVVSINATGLGATSSAIRLPTLLQSGQNTTTPVICSLVTSTTGAALQVRCDLPTGAVGTLAGNLVVVGISQPPTIVDQIGQVFQPVLEVTGNVTVASASTSPVQLNPLLGTYQRIKALWFVGNTAPAAGAALQFVDVATGQSLWTVRTTGAAQQQDFKACDIINLAGIQFSNNSTQAFIFGAECERYPA
jgi:hypothetical protein